MAAPVPTTLRTHLRAACLAALAFVLLGSIREDEFQCEEAAIHLDDCCPELATQSIDCWYDPGGCGADPKPTMLSVRQSKCIRSLDCAALVDHGVCRDVEAMLATSSATNPTQGGIRACD
jgi:hypothetical protein